MYNFFFPNLEDALMCNDNDNPDVPITCLTNRDELDGDALKEHLRVPIEATLERFPEDDVLFDIRTLHNDKLSRDHKLIKMIENIVLEAAHEGKKSNKGDVTICSGSGKTFTVFHGHPLSKTKPE